MKKEINNIKLEFVKKATITKDDLEDYEILGRNKRDGSIIGISLKELKRMLK